MSMAANSTKIPISAIRILNAMLKAVPIAVGRLVRCRAISCGMASLISNQATPISTAILAIDLSSSTQFCLDTMRPSPVIGLSLLNLG